MPLDNTDANINNEKRDPASAQNAITDTDSPSQPNDDERSKAKRPPSSWAEIWIAGFTGLMLVTYLTLTYFSCQQMRLTRDQVRIGQRAYLTVRHIEFKKRPSVGKPVTVSFEIENTGQTPAWDIRSDFSHIFVLPGEPEEVPYNPGPTGAPAFIGAGAKLATGSELITPLTKSQFDEIMNPEEISMKGSSINLAQHQHLYVMGLIRYKDVFGREHTYEFCTLYVAWHDSFIGCSSHQSSN